MLIKLYEGISSLKSGAKFSLTGLSSTSIFKYWCGITSQVPLIHNLISYTIQTQTVNHSHYINKVDRNSDYKDQRCHRVHKNFWLLERLIAGNMYTCLFSKINYNQSLWRAKWGSVSRVEQLYISYISICRLNFTSKNTAEFGETLVPNITLVPKYSNKTSTRQGLLLGN